MGGEPTFVSIDDMDGAEWNTAALGPNKRRLAEALFGRLAARRPRAALALRPGQVVPGRVPASLGVGVLLAQDGVPIWRCPELIAEDQTGDTAGRREAEALIGSLARRLRVSLEHVIEAYEDVWYCLWQERRLPVNVDPLQSDLKDCEERKRLAKNLERGLDEIVGYALPIRPRPAAQRRSDAPRWESGPWFFRGERMFLIPGDSPMGLRLPLDSIPWTAAEDQPQVPDRDPFDPRGPLPIVEPSAVLAARRQVATKSGRSRPEPVLVVPPHADGHRGPFVPAVSGQGSVSRLSLRESGAAFAEQKATLSRAYRQVPQHAIEERTSASSDAGRDADPDPTANPLPVQAAAAPRMGESAKQIIHTALCVEPRDGRLHVFMPPVTDLEDYLDLVTAVEETAAELGIPVRIEGYPPPHDHRLQSFKITPDPGVIEVNLQPAADWNELVENTTRLYEEARLSRLGTEKFMLDGRHTGTGGGNHLVLGGPTPTDSPLLRRPDLLRSLVSYWNNRPSLSYLFSGMFLGPTSQAPRIDEARHDSLYELEIAFGCLPEGQECRRGWSIGSFGICWWT